jgi:hypothetical protein
MEVVDILYEDDERKAHTHDLVLWPRRWHEYHYPGIHTWQIYRFVDSENPNIPDQSGIYTFIVQPGEKTLRNAYKDKEASKPFIARKLAVFTIYDKLRATHGQSLKFWTKDQLNFEKYDYFPKPMPDVYLTITRRAYGHVSVVSF